MSVGHLSKVFVLFLMMGTFGPVAEAVDGRMHPRVTIYETADILFEKGKTNISDSDRRNLGEVVKVARTKGKILRAEIVAWSDQSMPEKEQKLSKSEVKLAEERASHTTASMKESTLPIFANFSRTSAPSKVVVVLVVSGVNK